VTRRGRGVVRASRRPCGPTGH